jgi:hypothetical protein
LDIAEETLIGSGISAEAFDAMTPQEAEWQMRALAHADDREWLRTAQLAAWVLNSLGAKVSAHRLLGKPEPLNVKALLE